MFLSVTRKAQRNLSSTVDGAVKEIAQLMRQLFRFSYRFAAIAIINVIQVAAVVSGLRLHHNKNCFA